MSSLPDVLDALIAAAKAVGTGSALYGVQVFDGPPLGDVQPDYVTIGWTQNRPTTNVSYRTETYEGGGREIFDVPCTVRSWTGDKAVKARRDRAFAMLDALSGLADVLAADSLEVVAGVNLVGYTPTESAEGVQVVLDVLVNADVMT